MGTTLAIFGGSGATGTHVIAEAIDRGMEVRALVRGEGSLHAFESGVYVVTGSLQVPADVDLTLEGSNAACCVFGPRPPYTDIFCASATRIVVQGMEGLGIRRIICQTGGMVGDYPMNRTWAFRLLTAVNHKQLEALERDRAQQEQVVTESSLDWTIVKPPRLTTRPKGGRVTAGPSVRVGLLSSVPRADLAAFIVDEIENPSHIKSAVFVHG